MNENYKNSLHQQKPKQNNKKFQTFLLFLCFATLLMNEKKKLEGVGKETRMNYVMFFFVNFMNGKL